MTLSDSFCVERHRSDFISFIQNHVDILFCNEDELKSLFECDLESAKSKIKEICEESVITLGAKGATVFKDKVWNDIASYKPKSVIDTTGAGDLFAAGYLHGRCLGLNAEKCGFFGSVAASEIISHIGPRPVENLKSLLDSI